MPCPICPNCAGPYPGLPRSGITVHSEEVVRADKRYYVNADRSKIVEESDPQAAHLLAAEGDDISSEDVQKYGLGKKKADEKPAESKAVPAPPENKARTVGSVGGEKK